MFSVDSAMNRYAGVAAGSGGRAPERSGSEVAVPPNASGSAPLNGIRPSAVVNISAEGREQLERATAESATASNAAGPAEPVRAVAQAMVATNETNALQSRAADAQADSGPAARGPSATAAGRANPNIDVLARNAGPATAELGAAQDRDGARVN